MYMHHLCYKGQKTISAPLNGVRDDLAISHSIVLEIEPRSSERVKI